MNYFELKQYINSIDFDNKINVITCCDDISSEKQRYLNLLENAYKKYGDGDYHFVSSPGRSEICGNHTDHQHGHVVACSLNVDNVTIFKSNNTNTCNYTDDKFDSISVDITDLTKREEELNTSVSLIKGIAYKLSESGYSIGGFDAMCDSRVLIGSGISSSACFEVMVVEIFNALFNDEKVNPIERAIIGQYAENEYFGKPSGLMDQLAISSGGVVAIDFKNPNNPIIENYDFSFSDLGYDLLLVNTKGSHSDLSHEYAAIPNEIKEVCNVINVEYLADSSFEEFINSIPRIRKTINNDRAILRAFHFFKEDKRAIDFKKGIEEKNINKILDIINESGKSSYEYLQNVYPSSRTNIQPLSLALALTDEILKGDGAYRVHGGGFDGTIQVIIPSNKTTDYIEKISTVFGQNCVMKCLIRRRGTRVVI